MHMLPLSAFGNKMVWTRYFIRLIVYFHKDIIAVLLIFCTLAISHHMLPGFFLKHNEIIKQGFFCGGRRTSYNPLKICCFQQNLHLICIYVWLWENDAISSFSLTIEHLMKSPDQVLRTYSGCKEWWRFQIVSKFSVILY